jgi:hypothetical protein
MPSRRLSRLLIVAVVALFAGSLGGCGTINEKLTEGMADYVPQWAGGLPADAPPRPGTPQYDAFMKEAERRRAEPAVKRNAEQKNNAAAAEPAR